MTLQVSAVGIPVAIKDPDARLDYGFDWGVDGWLDQQAGETISALDVRQEHGPGATDLVIENASIAGGITIAWISGGTNGKDYRVTFEVTTSLNRRDDRTLILRVRQR